MNLELVRKIPPDVQIKEILHVLSEFYKDCEMYIDYTGFIAHTLERFSWATFMNQGNWDLWLATDEGEIKCFVLASVDKAADNNLCYYVHQGWVAKDIRESMVSRKWWLKVKERAKDLLCKQMMIFSIRDFDAYNRFFGGGMKVYAQMLHLQMEV